MRGVPRRVVVGGKMKFLPGMPTRSRKALLEAADADRSGAGRVWIRSHIDDTGEPCQHLPQQECYPRALWGDAEEGARRPRDDGEPSPGQIARAKIQTLAVADKFPDVMKDVIAIGVKTTSSTMSSPRTTATSSRFPTCSKIGPGRWMRSASRRVSWRSTRGEPKTRSWNS